MRFLISLLVLCFCSQAYAQQIASFFCFPVGTECSKPIGYYNAQDFRVYSKVKNGYHLGEDWNGMGGGSTDLGDAVYAIGNGVVTMSKYIAGGWGNTIIIRHKLSNGTLINSLYAHLHSRDVQVGQHVTVQQKI
jgi:murein DD-endopeptidase MepM/ murein hydrolase activator NlpD